jgi:hypothetical protein
MRKILNFFLIVFASILSAGIYGVFHDQITYSISPEYYTFFKFEQFGINEWGISSERLKVGIIGFLATWWVGLILGIVYALVSLFFNSKKVLTVTLKSIFLNICFSAIFGFLGFVYGAYFLREENLNWYIPKEITSSKDFISVGSIHNFGYVGGLAGLIVGIYFQIKKLKNNNVSFNERLIDF